MIFYFSSLPPALPCPCFLFSYYSFVFATSSPPLAQAIRSHFAISPWVVWLIVSSCLSSDFAFAFIIASCLILLLHHEKPFRVLARAVFFTQAWEGKQIVWGASDNNESQSVTNLLSAPQKPWALWFPEQFNQSRAGARATHHFCWITESDRKWRKFAFTKFPSRTFCLSENLIMRSWDRRRWESLAANPWLTWELSVASTWRREICNQKIGRKDLLTSPHAARDFEISDERETADWVQSEKVNIFLLHLRARVRSSFRNFFFLLESVLRVFTSSSRLWILSALPSCSVFN